MEVGGGRWRCPECRWMSAEVGKRRWRLVVVGGEWWMYVDVSRRSEVVGGGWWRPVEVFRRSVVVGGGW